MLHNTGQYRRAGQLADLVSGEDVVSACCKESIRDILGKLRESCLAAMEQGKDAWGYAKQ